MSSPTHTPKRRFVRALAIGSVVASLGLAAINESPASAAAPAHSQAVATASPATAHSSVAPATSRALTSQSTATHATRAAVAWRLTGIFPDPLTCHLAGIATGRPYYCSWYFFFWGLNVLS